MNESPSGIWWRLPGPSRFVARIIDAIRDGRHVIICRPRTACDGLFEAIVNALEEEDFSQRQRLSVAEEELDSPVGEFYDRFVQDANPAEVRNARSLAHAEDIAARFFWVQDMTQAVWNNWVDFIVEFQHASMAVEIFERPIICVELFGDIAAEPPEEDVCLAVFSEQGTTNETDAMLFASELTYDHDDKPVIKQLKTHVIARLAQWDASLAIRLSQCDLQSLLSPEGLLESYAKELGWEDFQEPAWHTGMLGEIDDEEKVHSAAVNAIDFAGTLTRRLWSAQVSVLLPYIEVERKRFIDHHGNLLEVPFSTQYGQTVNELCDLEIGHILYQVTTRRLPLPVHKRRHLKRLRDIRNALSHLECVTGALLEDI